MENLIKNIEEKLVSANGDNAKISVFIPVKIAYDFLDFLKLKAKKEPPEFSRIDKIVCEVFEIPENQLRNRVRNREIVQTRQAAMYFYRKYHPSLSYSKIGEMLSNENERKKFDHATVLHALRNTKNLYETDRRHRQLINKAELLINYMDS